jgi:hypothetical protein
MAGRSTRIGATTATIVESFGDLLNDTGCDATTPLVTPFSGDASGRITYSVGTINPGKSATMTFSYTLG